LPSPDQLLALPRRRFDDATSRLDRALVIGVERKRARLGGIKLSPATLDRRIEEAGKTVLRDFARAGRAFIILTAERRARIGRIGEQLPKGALTALRRHRQELGVAQARLGIEPVARRWRIAGERLGDLDRRRLQALAVRLERARARLTQAERLMSTLSHKAVLARGFALVRDAGGEVIKHAADVASGAALSLEFADGTADAVAVGGAAARPKPVAKPREPGNQGSLF
jgi:exodeoxyribonuclease VII large subunit